jgi:hypothetical protein
MTSSGIEPATPFGFYRSASINYAIGCTSKRGVTEKEHDMKRRNGKMEVRTEEIITNKT